MKVVWIVLIVLIIIIILVFLLKLYLVLTTAWDRSPSCLVGKTVLVTGANAGIGFYTAQDFAKRGARVILACRNLYKGEEAKTKIVEATGNSNVVVKIVDLSSLASVRKFAVEIKATESRLDILVNNAATKFFGHGITDDGLSLTMQVNHFGPFLLTILLLGLLRRSSPSRIVMVSASSARMAKLNTDDLNSVPYRCFKSMIAYSNTKLCNILMANELSRTLKGSGVTANSVHPGAVQTDIFSSVSPAKQKIVKFFSKLFYKETEAGAQTTIYVAVSKKLSGVSGAYFANCKEAKMPKAGNDLQLAKKVWEKSEQFVKLTADEKRFLET